MDNINNTEPTLEDKLTASGISPEDRDLWRQILTGIPNEEVAGLYTTLFDQSQEEILEFTTLIRANIAAAESGNSDTKKEIESSLFKSIIAEAQKKED